MICIFIILRCSFCTQDIHRSPSITGEGSSSAALHKVSPPFFSPTKGSSFFGDVTCADVRVAAVIFLANHNVTINFHDLKTH